MIWLSLIWRVKLVYILVFRSLNSNFWFWYVLIGLIVPGLARQQRENCVYFSLHFTLTSLASWPSTYFFLHSRWRLRPIPVQMRRLDALWHCFDLLIQWITHRWRSPSIYNEWQFALNTIHAHHALTFCIRALCTSHIVMCDSSKASVFI